MAFPVQITLGTGNKVSLNYQSQEVSVSVTYQLERGDADVLSVVREKTIELVTAHRLAWARVRGEEADEEETPPAAAPSPPEMVVEEETDAATPVAEELLSGAQMNAIEALFVQGGWSQSRIEEHLLEEFGKSEIFELSASQAAQLLLELQRAARLQAQAIKQQKRSPTNPNGRL